MEFSAETVLEYSEALASASAVPGGGSATALVSALAAALGGMVGRLTLGKAKYAAVEKDILRLTAEADALRTELLSLVDEDARAFEPLRRAYALPKDAPERAARIEAALGFACEPPMRVMRASCRGIELTRELADKGSELMISDAGCSAVFFWSALYASAVNVHVNTKAMTDRARAEALNAEADGLMNQYWTVADATYESVFGRLQ